MISKHNQTNIKIARRFLDKVQTLANQTKFFLSEDNTRELEVKAAISLVEQMHQDLQTAHRCLKKFLGEKI